MATRLSPLLSASIGPEQVGFMPGREAKGNINSLLLTQAVRNRKIGGLLLSTDTEKAFDWVAWDFMLATCAHVGLGSRMMS